MKRQRSLAEQQDRADLTVLAVLALIGCAALVVFVWSLLAMT